MKAEQLSIFLENKPGTLNEVISTLAAAGINLRALSLADTLEFGLLRLIVDRPEEARKALSEKGFTSHVTEVLAIEVSDKPGGLSRLLDAFARVGCNVEYMYAFVGNLGQGSAVVVFRIDELDKALSAITPDVGRVIPRAELYQR